jgi:N-acetylglucosamine-6-phosphate deacetylase
MLLRGRHYATGQMVEVACQGGTVCSLGPPGAGPADYEAGWLAPALFDLQINGCGGVGFAAPGLDAGKIWDMVRLLRRHGIGSFCPTLITNSHEAILAGCRALRLACDKDAKLAEALAAIHIEGPYICPEDGPRGAHPRQYVRKPNWDEFCRWQEAAGGRIRLVTLAPELEGAIAFIERLASAGVVVALGHTAAGREEIQAAIAAGARLSTHLGNGTHAMLARHENYVWEQLAADALDASIICDGHHLPPAVVRCLVRAKGIGRIILTCDASTLAGLPPGRYREWEQDIEVLPGGRVVLTGTPYLAGSGVFLDSCVDGVMRFADVPLREGIDMAGARPRALLGLPPCRLEPGMPAHLVLFDWEPGSNFRVVKTVIGEDVA